MPRLSTWTSTVILALATLISGAPTNDTLIFGRDSTSPSDPNADIEKRFTAASILSVAPQTSSCDFSLLECATAATAAPAIAVSFVNWQISSFGAQAAVLSLMLFESGNFKYNRNHFPAPGRPGQGTRNMQMPAYNLKYARWLADNCANCHISEEQVDAAEKAGPDDVLALVNGLQWSFGSAAWFLKTQCDPKILEGLADASEASWTAYIGCIGTEVTDDRKEGWKKVVALGKW